MEMSESEGSKEVISTAEQPGRHGDQKPTPSSEYPDQPATLSDKYRRAAWESQLQLRDVFPFSNPAQLVVPIFGVD